MLKCFIALLITFIIMPIFYFMVRPPPVLEQKLNHAMKSKNISQILKEYDNYLSDMIVKYILFLNVSFIYIIFSFYYLIVFSTVYPESSLGWIAGGLITLFLNMLGIVIPLLITIIRSIVKPYPNLR